MRRVCTLTGVLLLMLVPANAVASTNHSQGNSGTSGSYNSPQPTSKADQNSGGANGGCPGTSKGDYCSTRGLSSTPRSLNGNGKGKATGKPCAGCVGKADNKNPHGEYPNGSDHNNGYECDGNNGIGKTNPAHSGCNDPCATTTTTGPTTTSMPPGCVTTTTTPGSTTTTVPGSTTTTTVPGSTTTTVPGSTTTVPGSATTEPPTSVPTSVLGEQISRPATKVLGEQLARTGIAIGLVTLVGLGLAVGGVILVVGARRREQTP